MKTKILTATIFFLLLIVGPASAAQRSIASDLAIADRYWGQHQCVGKVEVVLDPTLRSKNANGEATGLVPHWSGSSFDWQFERCAISIYSKLKGQIRCSVIIHEVGHLVHGAGHEGPMSQEALLPAWDFCRATRSWRSSLVAGVRELLPKRRAWRVWCNRTSARIKCWAKRRKSRKRFIVLPSKYSGEFEGIIEIL